MSEKGSVFQKGGGGTNFEQAVQSTFLLSLLIQGNAPSLPTNKIIEVSFQNTSRGFETDDLLVTAKSNLGEHKLLMQIKHDISFTRKSALFKEVLTAFWKDYNNRNFNKQLDKLVVVKSGLTKNERQHFKTLLSWSNTHQTAYDFYNEVNRIQVKKENLSAIEEILEEINNEALTEDAVWMFLKCIEVFEYDLLEIGSVDRAYMLNLIKISKNKQSNENETDIWNKILALASHLNKDGGNVTSDSVKQNEISQHFSSELLTPFYESISKLIIDSTAILKPLKNTIGDLHLKRTDLNEVILESILSHDITIIVGKPGVGKSAQVKETFETNFHSATTFSFKADQFNESTLTKVFSNLGTNVSVFDIFSCVSMTRDKILFIDSLEKLLEADPDCAFKQLVNLLIDYPSIKLVATSRSYAVDLVIQKFGIQRTKLKILEVPLLLDSELVTIKKRYPFLEDLFKNPNIIQLLKTPKYLDFAINAIEKKSEDYSNIDVFEFKQRLWNALVVDEVNVKNGLPLKREKAFIEIATNRAKQMQTFISPMKADEEALEALVKDDILTQEYSKRKYAPSHDILEDWALIRLIAEMYDDSFSASTFFSTIGTEPAIRRAFRLWVEESITKQKSIVYDLVTKTRLDKSIPQYWQDELLIAIFLAEESKDIFIDYQDSLLEKDAQWLLRCLHILKTCCKENNDDSSLLMPIGSGWKEALIFISDHYKQLSLHKLNLVSFLSDWYIKLIYNRSLDEKELYAVKKITLSLINEIELEKSTIKESEDQIEYLIRILFDLSGIAGTEIKELLYRACSSKENRRWTLTKFYDKIIDSALAGIGNQYLISELPDTIIEIAWQEWKLPPPPPVPEDDFIGSIISKSLDNERCWGIKSKHEFFPSGIYKTPLYILLRCHAIKGLAFFIDFINYSVEHYVKAECSYKHDINEIEFELPGGRNKKIWGGWQLWCAYRGLSVTHYLLESLLMSFEKFLLDLANLNTENSRKNIATIFEYVYANTNNIAPLSILSSITMAYPKVVNESMLPLLKIREVYEYDLQRAIQEASSLAPYDDDLTIASEERSASNNLPHRKKFSRGIRDFILDYQFNVRTLNKEIHIILDDLRDKHDEEDIIWAKTLTEMDIRNHVIDDFDKELGGYPVRPLYNQNVNDFIDSNKQKYEQENKSQEQSYLLRQAYKLESKLNYSDWDNIYKDYLSRSELNFLYDIPCTLAHVGLRDFTDILNTQQKNWCIDTLLNTCFIIIKNSYKGPIYMGIDYNIMDKEVAINSFQYIIPHFPNDTSEYEAILLLILNLLVAPIQNHESKEFIKYIRNTISIDNFLDTEKISIALIKYAKYRKSNPINIYDSNLDLLNHKLTQQGEFLNEIIKSDNIDLDISTIKFDSYETSFLIQSLFSIPTNTQSNFLKEYIEHFTKLISESLTEELEDDYYNTSNRSIIRYHYYYEIKSYLAELFIKADPQFSIKILDILLEKGKVNKHRYDSSKFLLEVLDLTIYKLDEIITHTNDKAVLINNFWSVWEFLYSKTNEIENPIFIPQLLLDIRWRSNASSWEPLESKKLFYNNLILEFGVSNFQSILNIFSTIGEEVFMPEKLTWLVDTLNRHPELYERLLSPAAERLIKKLFYNHISQIKSRTEYISNYIWILDRMVDQGSSNAYLFRENVITYKG